MITDSGSELEPGSGAGARPRVRVGVVDDHEMFRAGVIKTISAECEVVGQAGDVESAVDMIAATQPDVVLLDVHLPGGQGGGGSEIILNAVDLAPQTLYLALSVSDSPVDVGAVIRAGARGYVTKTISAVDLLSSVHQVAQGYAVFSPKLAGFVLNAFEGSVAPFARSSAAAQSWSDESQMTAQPGPTALNPSLTPPSLNSAPTVMGPVSAAPTLSAPTNHNDSAIVTPPRSNLYLADTGDPYELDTLSPREKEVMQLIARGYSNKEVAAALFISIKTVETHASAVLRKLQLSNRGELARWAAHRKIV